jgi:hypothetical protein
MTIKKIVLCLLLLTSLSGMAQLEVGGIKVPYTYKTDETTLVINGAGIREKYFIDLYVGALYLKGKTTDATKIINADEPMAIKLHIISGMITSEKMTDATDEGFKKSTGGNTTPFAAKISQFKSVFKEKINKGDIYDIVYEPSKGVMIYKNSKLSSTIPGLDFKKALFGIWLCNQPADSDLKDKMLGK